MALISIIIGLLFDRAFRHLHDLRDLSWFEYYSNAVTRFIQANGVVQMIAILLFPVMVIATIQLLLSDFLLELPYLLFSVLVFAYCLGPACLSSDIEYYLDARRLGDEDEALHYAGALTERAASTAPDQQTNDVTRAILHVANERIFAVIFWFVIIGPAGAMLYRLTTNLSKQEGLNDSLSAVAILFQAVLTWVPARMLAMGYALTGHFDGALQAYRNRPYESDLALENYDVLVNTGMGALRDQEATDEISSIISARNLVMRSILIWIAVLALLTLGGWLG
ncbi:MAG: regulatory signaling modulator protein AmpE [Gammaproteobacteria bacterium]|nr:regulatory signaling modulator protein AmpE [Gammaproteobacteria bacterium]